MTTRTKIQAAALASALVALSACAPVKTMYEPNPQVASQQPIAPEARVVWEKPQTTDGSLWNGSAAHLFTDEKAHHPGDIVLVNVAQKNTGSKDATTDTSRDSSFSASIKRFLGFEEPINGLTGYTKNKANPKSDSAGFDPYPLVDAQTSNSFKGAGTTNRSDDLEATVSAIVTDILPNGNLVIYGHQTVTLNHEASVLTVQGIVRPTDISRDNTIDSERIANADIRFTGSGVITDKQHPGWATRALDWVLPF